MGEEVLLAALVADRKSRAARIGEMVVASGGPRAFLEHGHVELSPSECRRRRSLAKLLRLRALAEAPRPRFLDKGALLAWARTALGPLVQEELWLVALDAGLRVRGVRLIARGASNRLLITPRDCLREVLKLAGTAFVLIHNHPGGDPRPSDEDRSFTKSMVDAGALVGVPLVDHLVVSEGGSHSILSE